MNDLIITRFCYSDLGTFGKMTVDGITLFTVERPWLHNMPGVSCIPIGNYKCKPRRFYRGNYDAVEVMDVPNRTHILFHIANKPNEVQGCIGVNSSLGCLNGEWAGLTSRMAFKVFMENYNREFSLRVKNLDYCGVLL